MFTDDIISQLVPKIFFPKVDIDVESISVSERFSEQYLSLLSPTITDNTKRMQIVLMKMRLCFSPRSYRNKN